MTQTVDTFQAEWQRRDARFAAALQALYGKAVALFRCHNCGRAIVSRLIHEHWRACPTCGYPRA